VAVGTSHPVPDAYQGLADCRDVTRHGSLALGGYRPRAEVLDVDRHLQDCNGCAAHVGQMAATAAVLGARLTTRQIGSAVDGPAGPAATGPQTFDQSQRVLAALARAADPEHADDLVQETWDHFLSATPAEVPGRDVLVEYLMQRVDDHQQQEDLTPARGRRACCGITRTTRPTSGSRTFLLIRVAMVPSGSWRIWMRSTQMPSGQNSCSRTSTAMDRTRAGGRARPMHRRRSADSWGPMRK
jgi:hypothetical protein